jgi:NACalpha-BTF3-like transcription factor
MNAPSSIPEENEIIIDETTAKTLTELQAENKELKPDIKQAFVDMDKATQEAQAGAVEEVAREQEGEWQLSYDDLMKTVSGKEEAAAIDERIKAFRESIKANKAPAWVISVIETIFTFIKDIWLIGDYAKIMGEKSRLQPLRAEVRPQLMEIDRAIAYWLREPSFEPELNDVLSKYGFKDEDITRLKTLAYYIPQPQDVIRFAVREVYDPAKVARFGMLEGLDNIEVNVRPDIEKAGLQWDTFKKYWAAHWELPSPQQAFEMFQRGFIDEATLRMILIAADFMPGFIEPFMQIAYVPTTRVDTRRMFRPLGKDREWLIRKYKDLGYNQENAENLSDFVIWDTDPQRKAEEKKAANKELTKADIESAFKSQMISRDTAIEYLEALGYDNDECEFYISRIELQAERERIEQLTAQYKKAYTGGLWDKTDLLSHLNKLDLPSKQIDTLLELWEIEKEIKLERPTKAEILQFYSNNLMTEQQARKELALNGYTDNYIDLYIKTSKVKKGE